jgi:GTP cyclohydrolase-4
LTDRHTVYLGLGTNLGDRQANLAEARGRLEEVFTIEGASSVYETEPWGFEDQPAFLNQVLVGLTDLPPDALLTSVKAIEGQMGRKPSFRYGPRLIDIDILIYDQVQLDSPSLTLPHPRLTERAFVLIPLAELAPDLRIPGTDRTAGEWAAQLDRAGGVVRWTQEVGDD